MKKNISTVIFLIISLITFIFIVYYSTFSVETALSINKNDKLILIKPDSSIEYYGEDNVFIVDSDKTIYLSLALLSEHLNVKTIFDAEDKIAIITTENKVIKFYGKTNEVKINNRKVNHIKPMIINDEKPLLPVSQIKEDINIVSNILNEDSIVVRSLLDNEIMGQVGKDRIILKKNKNITSEIVGVLDNNNHTIKIIGQDTEWLRILTKGGSEGFVKKKFINNIEVISGLEPIKSEALWKPKSDKIFLAWENVHSLNPDTEKIKEMNGVNVISPTWIKLTDSTGVIKENISKDYIAWSKNRGYKVWALFSNSFDPVLTDEFLNDSMARERVINDLLNLIKQNNMDGINIDFENVYLKNKEVFVQFLRELTPIFHENGLVVSIDVTVKGGSENWSKFYDRGALGEIVDYMAVMTYDEHWASSPKSGSVASIGWVEEGIKGILEEVPAEKLLLGVPFYTRIWIETPSKDSNEKSVKSKAISMKTSMDIIKKDNRIVTWDEHSGQHYVEYIKDNKTYKIWIEDEKSIKLKTDLVKKYNLAGVAAWKRGFETEEIWHTINNNINKN